MTKFVEIVHVDCEGLDAAAAAAAEDFDGDKCVWCG